MKVLIVGTGRMGSQIGAEFALHRHVVTYMTRDEGAARSRICQAFGLARRHGLASGRQVRDAQATVGYTQAPDDDYDLVLESVPEDLELKTCVLKGLARAAPRAVLGTNTSSLSVTALGIAVEAPQRVVGLHYWNPPLLMPLVEIVAGEQTAEHAIACARDAVESVGKRPVLVERDVPGFIWNRLQLAVIREALWLVEMGVATPETVDEVMRLGLARRWRATGPFETVALGGVDTFVRAGRRIFPTLSHADSADALPKYVPTDETALEELADLRDALLAKELRNDIHGRLCELPGEPAR